MTLLELLSVIKNGQQIEISHYSKNSPLYKGDVSELTVKGFERWLDMEVLIIETPSYEKDIIFITLMGEVI